MQLILSPAQLLGNLAAVNSNLLKKWSDLFQAYDIGESGTISCSDFVKLEIRNGLEQGDFEENREGLSQHAAGGSIFQRAYGFHAILQDAPQFF